MSDLKKKLKTAKLYLVLDRQVREYAELFDILKQAVAGGVDIVQLRDKNGSARDIVEFSTKALRYLRQRVPFILNDRLDLALAVGADGVHLGQDDLDLGMARKIAKNQLLIGVSCQTLNSARTAEKQGADYIGFGSIFPTLTKPERRGMDLQQLKIVAARIKIPLFPIGGIGLANIKLLPPLGIRRAAVTRAICLAKDVAGATKLLRKTLE